MLFLRLPAIIAAFLIITVSIPQSFYSQKAPKPSQPIQPAPRQRRREARGPEGLQEIVERGELEGGRGEAVVRRREDDRGRVPRALEQVDPRQAGELDVEEHEVGPELVDGAHRARAVGGL